ncbi:hypothetical protein CC2G_000396 [Coprinopsis cinerea AmutBmut pab1-1]|nr:hypothetical protein CC2G_000396 [Coprinopsis cinerea AmutBmut pab1-1]
MSMHSARRAAFPFPVGHGNHGSLFTIAAPVIAPVSWFIASSAQAYVLVTSAYSSPSNFGSSDAMLFALTIFVSLLGGLWMGFDFAPAGSVATTSGATAIHSISLRQAPMNSEKMPLLESFKQLGTGEKGVLVLQGGQIQLTYGDPNPWTPVARKGGSRPRSLSRAYRPYFIAGNMSFVAWSLLWTYKFYIASQLVLVANLVTQNYVVFIVLHAWRNTRPKVNHTSNWFTHLLSKGNAAMTFLLLWKNSGILEKAASPTISEMINNAVIFILMAIGAGPDPTLGIYLLYDLIALSCGTTEDKAGWQTAFQMTALCLLFIMAWDLSDIWGGEKEHDDGEEDEDGMDDQVVGSHLRFV